MQNKSPQSAMNRPSMDAMNRLLRILLLSFVFHVISAQTGILSIDCGANESYADPVTKIQWVPDTNYTNSGLKSNVANQNVSKELRTLRYFPNSSISNCYVMPISTDQKYFFRANFLYGNYDAKNHWPSFNLSFDVGNWTHELVGTNYSSNQTISIELIFPAKQSSNVSLCFSSNDLIKDVPFISSLDLRPLPANSYQAYLQLRARMYFNRAANSILRFRYDKYHREWVARSSLPPFANVVSSNITIDTAAGYNNEPLILVIASTFEENMFWFPVGCNFVLAIMVLLFNLKLTYRK